jgi:hypothetical protein
MFFTGQTFSGVHISIKKGPSNLHFFLCLSLSPARIKSKQKEVAGKKENGKLHNEQFLM